MKDYPVLLKYNHKRKRETGESVKRRRWGDRSKGWGWGQGFEDLLLPVFEDGRSGHDPRQAGSL